MKTLLLISLFLLTQAASANPYLICKPGVVNKESIDSVCFDYTKIESYEIIDSTYLKIKLFNVATTLKIKMKEEQRLELTKP